MLLKKAVYKLLKVQQEIWLQVDRTRETVIARKGGCGDTSLQEFYTMFSM